MAISVIGALPRWRPDGKELFYDAGGPLMAATWREMETASSCFVGRTAGSRIRRTRSSWCLNFLSGSAR